MSKKYSIAEARSNLAAIVDQAESGLEIELTRRGKPVVAVVSIQHLERLRSAQSRPRFGDVYKEFLRKHKLEEIGIEGDFARSLRAKDGGRKVLL